MVPSPLKHVVLRIISFIFRKKLIPVLKKIMIFGDKASADTFTREIIIENDRLIVKDEFNKKKQGLYRAPHYSLRHVSSAGLFTPEELLEIPDGNWGKIDKKDVNTRYIKL